MPPAPPGETTFQHGDLTLFLPAQSRLLLDGVTIDFAETPTSAGLVFIDPKKKNLRLLLRRRRRPRVR